MDRGEGGGSWSGFGAHRRSLWKIAESIALFEWKRVHEEMSCNHHTFTLLRSREGPKRNNIPQLAPLSLLALATHQKRTFRERQPSL
jgi:hypothetical protein